MAKQVTVRTGSGTYPVIIGPGLDCGALALTVKKPCRAVIVSDDNVFPLYGERVAGSFRESGYTVGSFVIKNGEASKTLGTAARILEFLARERVTRGDMLVALGGGVVGDLTGFVSAVYLRGVDFLQLPTTVLAAVDSSVGGKTGVDLSAGKNLAGAFHQPRAVLCDTGVFATLPAGVYADGMAEAVKHGMIADRELLLTLGELPIDEVCARNVAIKARAVEEDEFDTGARRLLNFGHTVGHAVETLSGYRVPHGSAVAIGMAVITRASERLGLTQAGCLDALIHALERYGLPTRYRYAAGELAEAARGDKKRVGDRLSLVIPERLGKAVIYDIPVTELEDFIARGLD